MISFPSFKEIFRTIEIEIIYFENLFLEEYWIYWREFLRINYLVSGLRNTNILKVFLVFVCLFNSSKPEQRRELSLNFQLSCVKNIDQLGGWERSFPSSDWSCDSHTTQKGDGGICIQF